MLVNYSIILIMMIFLHIFDDFHLQGILASMKQKSYWVDECKKYDIEYDKYKHDWIVALIMHSISWSFMIMLPILLFIQYKSLMYIIAFITNTTVHCVTDHLKCNLFKINLVQDQTIHILQILLTWLIFIIY